MSAALTVPSGDTGLEDEELGDSGFGRRDDDSGGKDSLNEDDVTFGFQGDVKHLRRVGIHGGHGGSKLHRRRLPWRHLGQPAQWRRGWMGGGQLLFLLLCREFCIYMSASSLQLTLFNSATCSRFQMLDKFTKKSI